MKHQPTLILSILAAARLSLPAQAQLTIPSDGSDRAFNPIANVEINLLGGVMLRDK